MLTLTIIESVVLWPLVQGWWFLKSLLNEHIITSPCILTSIKNACNWFLTDQNPIFWYYTLTRHNSLFILFPVYALFNKAWSFSADWELILYHVELYGFFFGAKSEEGGCTGFKEVNDLLNSRCSVLDGLRAAMPARWCSLVINGGQNSVRVQSMVRLLFHAHLKSARSSSRERHGRVAITTWSIDPEHWSFQKVLVLSALHWLGPWWRLPGDHMSIAKYFSRLSSVEFAWEWRISADNGRVMAEYLILMLVAKCHLIGEMHMWYCGRKKETWLSRPLAAMLHLVSFLSKWLVCTISYWLFFLYDLIELLCEHQKPCVNVCLPWSQEVYKEAKPALRLLEVIS